MSFSQSLAKDKEVWHSLFKNPMARILALRRRFPGPRITGEVFWETADAAPDVVGVAGRGNRHYRKLHDEETMTSFGRGCAITHDR